MNFSLSLIYQGDKLSNLGYKLGTNNNIDKIRYLKDSLTVPKQADNKFAKHIKKSEFFYACVIWLRKNPRKDRSEDLAKYIKGL